ncbi:phage tail assembly chaperone G [Latilactobacillus curvatus]
MEIELNINGEIKKFTRTKPLSLADTLLSLELQLKQQKRAEKESETAKDLKDNLNDICEFLSKFFDNQFSLKEAYEGLDPKNIVTVNGLVEQALGGEDENL